jgi:hypothetical protein
LSIWQEADVNDASNKSVVNLAMYLLPGSGMNIMIFLWKYDCRAWILTRQLYGVKKNRSQNESVESRFYSFFSSDSWILASEFCFSFDSSRNAQIVLIG